MIKIKLTCILFFVTSLLHAQDNIVFRNGDEAKGKVLEVTDELVKFKSADNPDGPIYSYKKSEILFIKYENGKKETFNEQQNIIPDNKLVYVAPRHLHKNNPDESTVSFIFRTGYEYSHYHESLASYYYSYQYGTYFAQTENYFNLELLAGKRLKHYQFGAGFGFYYKDVRVHDSRPDNNNTSWIDVHTEYSEIGLNLIFSNRIYLSDNKFSPFMLTDIHLAFDNVFSLMEGNQDYLKSYYKYSDPFFAPRVYYTLGAGVEMKTTKKYKLQLELGVKLKIAFSATNNQSLLHTGLSYLF